MVVLNYFNEIWKDIPDYEGYYQASNFGRIKSLNYKKTGKEQILKLRVNKHGYLNVGLFKNGKEKSYLVHRLVWLAFHEEIPEGMQINHINEVVSDNRLENLELVTPKENTNWGTGIQRRVEKTRKPILQYSLEGELIKEFPSQTEVQRQLGFKQSHVSSCCIGKLKSAYGYFWKFK